MEAPSLFRLMLTEKHVGQGEVRKDVSEAESHVENALHYRNQFSVSEISNLCEVDREEEGRVNSAGLSPRHCDLEEFYCQKENLEKR